MKNKKEIFWLDEDCKFYQLMFTALERDGYEIVSSVVLPEEGTWEKLFQETSAVVVDPTNFLSESGNASDDLDKLVSFCNKSGVLVVFFTSDKNFFSPPSPGIARVISKAKVPRTKSIDEQLEEILASH